MDNLNIKLPKSWLVFFDSREKIEEEIRMVIVLEWVRLHKISQGKGAELLGMNRWDFFDLMTEHKIPAIDISPDELDEDLKNIDEVLSELE